MHAKPLPSARQNIWYAKPVLSIDLAYQPDYSGTLVVELISGNVVSCMPLKKNEVINTLDGFLSTAKYFGWTVIPPENHSDNVEDLSE
jgi:hypothetical protein